MRPSSITDSRLTHFFNLHLLQLELERRREIELKEFEQVKDVNPDGYEGRTTGSLEWRLARGETGHGTVQKPSEMVVYAPIELTDVEVENKVFHLKYSSRSDKYDIKK